MSARLRQHYASSRLPLWFRVILVALDHDGLPLERRQLRDLLDPQHLVRPSEVARAVTRAVRSGMLDPASSTACLRLASPEPGALIQRVPQDAA